MPSAIFLVKILCEFSLFNASLIVPLNLKARSITKLPHFLLLLVPSSSLEYPPRPLEEEELAPSESELTVCALEACAPEEGLSTSLSEGFFPPVLKLNSSDSAIFQYGGKIPPKFVTNFCSQTPIFIPITRSRMRA